MAKKILLITSNPETIDLFNFFKELSLNNNELSFLSSDAEIINKAKEADWDYKKIKKPFMPNSSFAYFLFYIISFFPKSFYWLIKIWRYKKNKDIKNIILFNWPEKIFITPISFILKLNTVWYFLPGSEYDNLNLFAKKLIKIFSNKATSIVINDFCKNKLIKNGINKEKIYIINLGIKSNNYQLQENIFEKIAENNHDHNKKKFFTVGTVASLNKEKTLETLFQAIKKCLDVIPSLQLIIIGEGAEQNKLKWITKKMGIENSVWFVGDKKNYRKWFESFDIFIAVCESLRLKDTQTILRAMHSQLPIIAPSGIGFETILADDSGIITDFNESENIATEIINLHRNSLMLNRTGKNAQAKVDKDFTLDKMVQLTEKILY